MTDSSNYYLDEHDIKMMRKDTEEKDTEKARQKVLYDLERPEVVPLHEYETRPNWGFGDCIVEFRGEIYSVSEKWLNGVEDAWWWYPLSERESCYDPKR